MAGSDKTIKVNIMIDGQEKVVTSYDEIKEHAKAANNEMLSIKDQLRGLNAELALAAEARDKALMDQISAQIRQLTDQLNMQKIIRDGFNREARELLKAQTDLNNIYQRMQGEGDGPYTVSQRKKDLRTVQNKYSYIDPADTENVEKMRAMMGELNYELKEEEKNMKAVIMPAEKLQKILADASNPTIGASLNDMKAALAEVKRQMDGMKETEPGFALAAERYKNLSGHIEEYKKKLKEADDERKKLEQTEADKRLWTDYDLRGDDSKFTVDQYKELEKAIERLKATTEVGSLEYKEYEEALHDIKKVMGEYRKELQDTDREEAKLTKEEEKRNEQRAKDVDLWNKYSYNESLNVGQLQELQQSIGRLMKAESVGSDVYNSFAQAQRDIAASLGEFNEAAKEAEKEAKKLKAAQDQLEKDWNAYRSVEDLDVDDIADSKTVDQLKELDKSLERIKGTLHTTDEEYQNLVEKQNQVRSVLGKTTAETKKSVEGYNGVNYVLRHLDSAPLNHLKEAQKELKEEIGRTNTDTDRYIRLTEQYKLVSERIKAVNQEMSDHKNQLEQAIDRVKTYVTVYVGFGKLMDMWNNIKDSAFEISDLMSDIQKRTQLQPSVIREIGDTLNDIYYNMDEHMSRGVFDTRTSQQELFQLAATAGLLGLKSKEDVLGFTEAANYAKVALVELGDEGAEKLMKISTVTGDVARYGVKDAMTKVSSSINALTAASAASAGPITDFISRVGAVGATCGVSISEVAGLGATLDALGQKTEMSATSMNKIIFALKYNHRGIAAALGMDADNLEQLVSSGKTMEALVQVIEKMKATGGDIMPLLGEMDSERGARLKQTLSTLVNNAGMLRKQIALSNEEFEKGTSVINEYNVKNENAAAYWERAQNNFKKAFVGTEAVDFARGIAKIFYEISKIAGSLPALIFAITGAISGWKVAVVATSGAFGKLIDKIRHTETRMQLLGNVGKKAIGGIVGMVAMLLAVKVIEWFGKIEDRAKQAVQAVGGWWSAVRAKYKEAQKESESYFKVLRKWQKEGKAGTQEYADTIEEVNAKYGKLIGFTVTQTTSLKELELAQKAVNEALQENIILQERATRESQIRMQNAEEKDEAFNAINTKLTTANTLTIGDKKYNVNPIADRYIGHVNRAITLALDRAAKANIGTSVQDLSSRILPLIVEEFNNINLKNAEQHARVVLKEIGNYYRYVKQESDLIKQMDSRLESNLDAAKQNKLDAIIGQLKNYEAEYAELLPNAKDHADKLIEIQGNYSSIVSKNIDDLRKYDKAFANHTDTQQAYFKRQEQNINQYTSFFTQFGKSTEFIPGMSGGTLYDYSKKLRKEWDLWNKNADFERFGLRVKGQGFESAEQAQMWIESQVKAIESRAKELHIPRPSDWDYGKGGKEKNPAKDEMAAMLDMLEDYFIRRKTLIEESRVKEEISEGEYQRQLETLEEAHLDARTKLRSEWLDVDATNFKYMEEELWKDQIGYTEKQLNILRGNLKKLQKDEYGKTLAEIRKKRSEDWLKMQVDANKHRAALEKALLDGDQLAKMVDDFQKSLDQLDLIFGMSNDRTDAEAQRRILILQKMARQMEGVFSVEDMRAMLSRFGLTDILGLDDDHIRVLMDKLNDFSDQYESAIKTMASKAEKLYKSQMRSGAWDRMAVQYIDEMIRQAQSHKVYDTISNADFFEATSPVVETEVVVKTRVVDTEGKTIEKVDGDATEAVRKAVVDMFNADPKKVWNVSAIRAAAEKRGGEVAKLFAGLQDSEVKRIADELRKLQPQKQITRRVTVEGNTRADIVMKRMMEEFGLTADQAAGIAGNIGWESGGFNPAAKNPTTGMYGLAQWDKYRRGKFQQYTGRSIYGSSFEQQLNFIVHELKTSHRNAILAVKDATSAKEAADAFEGTYEISGRDHMADRRRLAKAYLQNFKGTVVETINETKAAVASVDKLKSVADLLTVKTKEIIDAEHREEEYEEVLERTVEKFDAEKTANLQSQLVSLYNNNLGVEWTKDTLVGLAKQQMTDLGDFLEKMADDEIDAIVKRLNDYTVAHAQIADKQQLAELESMRKTLLDRASRARTFYDDQDAMLKRLQERNDRIGRMEGEGAVSVLATDQASIDVARMEVEIANDYVEILKLRFAWEKNNLEVEKQRLVVERDQLEVNDPMRQIKQNEIDEVSLKIEALRQEELAATSTAMDELRKKYEFMQETWNKYVSDIRKRVNEYSADLKGMIENIASAGSEHANLTSLAEIAAKRKLGIAVDETKQEYLIYSRSGKAIRKMMTEEEKLQWDMENDARNQRLDAISDWLKKMGEKMSEDITNAFANRIALAQQEEAERQELERINSTANAKKQVEMSVTQARQNQFQSQFVSFKEEQDAELEYARQIAQQKAALGTSGETASAMSTATIASPVGANSVLAATGQGESYNYASDLVGTYMNFAAEEMSSLGLPQYAEQVLESVNIIDGAYRGMFESVTVGNTQATRQMTKEQQQMTTAMCQAANIYGIAYNAVMNENLSVTQKMGLIIIQSMGQVLMTVLSSALSMAIADNSLNLAQAIGKCFAQLGPWGWAAVAGITGALGAGMALATKAVTKSKNEISALTGAAAGGKKVAAGMLTYANGNYPVLGSDGEVYDAKRETNWKTKVYSSPHYGILGEKGPELIVDGVTTRKMMTLRPDLYQDILALAHGQQAVRARVYANGNYPVMPAANFTGTVATDAQSMLMAVLSQLSNATSNLNAQLANGITIDALGERGAVKQMAQAESWMRKHGLV